MTVRECYEELGSDFDKVLSRLVSEALVKKFALKFLDDPSFAPSQKLTEKLRGATTIEGTDELFAAVEKEYDRTCEALRKIA